MVVDLLDVAPSLSLDADYIAGASMALLGKRGAGKSYTARVLVEALFDAHVQTVVLDPMRVFWGLRSSADGTREGLPIPVFGGEHADLPLEPTAGAVMADLVVGQRLSMVLDMSGFATRAAERTFVATFLDRLYRKNRDLVHVIIDEADLYAPQVGRREDAHLLATMENLVRRGRNRGLGSTLATQRAASLAKAVLTQVDALVALRVTAPQDRDTIREWVRGQGDDLDWATISDSLPGLGNGESWWWIPEKATLQRAQVRPARTFDSSPTRRRGQSRRAPATFADVNLAQIREHMAATIEQVAASDPATLIARITDLEQQLTHAKASAAPVPSAPAVDPEHLAAIQSALQQAQSARDHAATLVQDANRALTEVSQDLSQITALTHQLASTDAPATGARKPKLPAPTPSTTKKQTGQPTPQSPASASTPALGTVTPARQRLLDALASLYQVGIDPAGKTQVALWAGVSPKSSGYANNLGALRTLDLIDYPAPGTVSLTGQGYATVGTVEPIRSDSELHQRVQTLISPARWRILAPLITAWPHPLSRADLAAAAHVAPTSSGYANNLGALRTLGLIDYPAPGTVCAADVLFLRRTR